MRNHNKFSAILRGSLLFQSLALGSLPAYAGHQCPGKTLPDKEAAQLREKVSNIEPYAANGDPQAQLMLGKLFYTGLGLCKSERQAVKWYRKAAEQGLADAQYELGLMYMEGSGVQKNKGVAIDWMYQAASQGHAYAKFVYNSLINEDFSIGC